MGDSLDRVRSFAKRAKQQVGFELEMLQFGSEPTDWKPMRAIGPGAGEIRVHLLGEYRVFYVAKFERAVYVLHAFIKKTQRTPNAAISLARVRYREVLQREGLKK